MNEERKRKKLEEYQEQLLTFEKLLSQFSEEAQMNYYKNKQTLEIYTVDNLGYFDGGYDSHSNEINLLNEDALLHELAHMAFSNKDEINKKVIQRYIKKNGIILKRKNSTFGIGINEGFAESFARRAGKIPNMRSFEAFIVNLLVTIYGEEIYEFPLKNDPAGFYNYCSQNIVYLASALDTYTNNSEYAAGVVYVLNNDIKVSKRFLKKSMAHFEISYPSSIINTIICIINEYKSCDNPKVTRIEFKEELEKFFDDESFKEADELLTSKFNRNLRQEIEEIIDIELMGKRRIK